MTPRSENEITNLDVLRQQLRNYYGDPWGTGVAAGDGNYAAEVGLVVAAGRQWLTSQHQTVGTPAIVLDVDDTLLLNWGYQVFSNWAYNSTSYATFVTEQWFPAVFGMVDLVRAAERAGYAIFYLTGRQSAAEAATLGNLTSDGIGIDAGYPAPTTLPTGEDGLFTHPPVAEYPDYLAAACSGDADGTCTTIHYKSATRAHLAAHGYHIVASFGDQHSDLEGGYADRTFKLPNPNYLIP
jgi:predicted secreted acid phosphatase